MKFRTPLELGLLIRRARHARGMTRNGTTAWGLPTAWCESTRLDRLEERIGARAMACQATMRA